jgi:hypothetical protein
LQLCTQLLSWYPASALALPLAGASLFLLCFNLCYSSQVPMRYNRSVPPIDGNLSVGDPVSCLSPGLSFAIPHVFPLAHFLLSFFMIWRGNCTIEGTLAMEDLLPPYSLEERSRELCMSSKALCHRARKVLKRSKELRDKSNAILRRLKEKCPNI